MTNRVWACKHRAKDLGAIEDANHAKAFASFFQSSGSDGSSDK